MKKQPTFRDILAILKNMSNEQLNHSVIVLPVSNSNKDYIIIEGDSCLKNSFEIVLADSDIVHKTGQCCGADLSGICSVSSLISDNLSVKKLEKDEEPSGDEEVYYEESDIVVKKGMPFIRVIIEND